MSVFSWYSNRVWIGDKNFSMWLGKVKYEYKFRLGLLGYYVLRWWYSGGRGYSNEGF